MAVKRIEMVSDFACPWCYFSAPALATLEQEGVEVVRRSFQILPFLPLSGISVAEYDAMRGNTPQDRCDKNQMTAQYLASLDLPWVPRQQFFQSRPAHLLHHWASSLGLGGEAFYRIVFDLQYAEGRNIAEPAVLHEIAARAGLPVEQVDQALSDPRWADEFEQDLQFARERGIHGVPYYVIEGQVYPGYRSLEGLRALLAQF
jgi:predicted DsbA family dithiol-disulfide isomerase